MSRREKAVSLLKSLPRLRLDTLKPLPVAPAYQPRKGPRKGKGGKLSGQHKRGKLPALGFEGGNTKFYLRLPSETYYEAHHLRYQYYPLSLLELQRAIDMGRIDADRPIDINSICSSFIWNPPKHEHECNKIYGVHLTGEGADNFAARLNIEVQYADEMAIAAVERNGGHVLTRFFDFVSLSCLMYPKLWFMSGRPIPKCKLPPQMYVDYYSDPRNRGYLADPEEIERARLILSQKFGYALPADCLSRDNLTKGVRQVFYNLRAGWIVSMRDKKVYAPVKGENADLDAFYGDEEELTDIIKRSHEIIDVEEDLRDVEILGKRSVRKLTDTQQSITESNEQFDMWTRQGPDNNKKHYR